MSPERPPSQDSGGGNVIEPTNMVLSTIPLESGHVVIQHHHHNNNQQQQTIQSTGNNGNYTQIHRSPQNIITTTTSNQTKLTQTSVTNPSPSKYVVFHPNGNGQYTANETTAYLTTSQTNGVGNIVLVATEPMEVSNNEQNIIVNTNGTDEELTSLTWLHDKNLIKGIVACTNSKSAAASPIRQSNGVITNNGNGAISPTSDFLEDSCVSEDNASSANSSSDQGISIRSAEYSPTPIINNGFTLHQHHNQFQHNSHPQQHHIHYTNNNNNSSTSKNRNHLLSPTSIAITNNIPQDHLQNGANLTVGATTVHVGPSGTTTVVEYKSGTNFNPSPRHFAQVPSSTLSPQCSPPPNSINVSSTTTTTSTNNSSTSTPHHQHFHKKYLREQMNGFDQNGFNNNNNNNNNNNRNNNNNVNENGNDFNATSPTPKSTRIVEQTITNIQDLEEFHHHTPIKVVPINFSCNNSNNNDDIKESSIQYENSSNSVGIGGGNGRNSQKSVASPKQKHPTNLPYDPMVHTTNKPPYSFSSLIFMAIEDSPEKALPVKEIYAWIVQHFPYFKTAPNGWKNSVRHNLSLNKSFLKVEKAPNMGKGSLWRVEQQQRPNLIQALTRSPFFPCSAVDKMSPYKSPTASRIIDDSPPLTPNKSTLDARLFPKLSKMIKQMETKGSYSNDQEDCNQSYNNNNNDEYYTNNGVISINRNNNVVINQHYENIERLARDCGADSIDDVNAATAMLALKHGPKVFTESFQNGSPVITSSPSEDHTYSAGGGGGGGSTSSGNVHSQNGSDNTSNGASSDAAYDSSDESHHVTAEELEERRRHAEGVDALLSFASKVSSMSSSATSSQAKRPASTSIDDEHISPYMENIPNLGSTDIHHHHHIILNEDESIAADGTIIYQHKQYDPQNYYHQLSSPSPAKKLKPPRSLRTKLKRKATWIR